MVLQTMLHYSDSRILTLISDSLAEVYDILDTAHPAHVPVFLGILHALVASMERWNNSEGGTRGDGGGNSSNSNESGDGSGHAGDISDDDDDGSDGHGEGSEEDEETDSGPKLPPPLCMEHQIVSDILERCPHYLGHASLQCR